jgi:hypothetical protein
MPAMNRCTINTRTRGPVEFCAKKNGGYIFVDLNGQPGTLGWQVCEGGETSGHALSAKSQQHLERVVRRWWAARLRNRAAVSL